MTNRKRGVGPSSPKRNVMGLTTSNGRELRFFTFSRPTQRMRQEAIWLSESQPKRTGPYVGDASSGVFMGRGYRVPFVKKQLDHKPWGISLGNGLSEFVSEPLEPLFGLDYHLAPIQGPNEESPNEYEQTKGLIMYGQSMETHPIQSRPIYAQPNHGYPIQGRPTQDHPAHGSPLPNNTVQAYPPRSGLQKPLGQDGLTPTRPDIPRIPHAQPCKTSLRWAPQWKPQQGDSTWKYVDANGLETTTYPLY